MAEILYGIKKIAIHELDPSTQLPLQGGICVIGKTAEECALEPVVSEGEETIKRVDNQILAVASTDDILYGYDVTLVDNVLDIEMASLMSGLKLVKEEEEVTGYETPLLKDGVVFRPFALDIFCANYEGQSIKGYVKIRLNYCRGKANKFEVKKEFQMPEFSVSAREPSKAGLPIKKLSLLTELPTDEDIKKENTPSLPS